MILFMSQRKMSVYTRDSFANVVDLLDDMFERCASIDEPLYMNFVKKHASELSSEGVTERTAARLFSNP
jgi:magnesium chelatase subunit H